MPTKVRDYSILIMGAGLLTLLLLFIYMERQNMRLTLLIFLPVTIVVIRIYWGLRKRIWFWAVIVLMMGLHIPLVFIVRMPERWVPPMALLPIVLADVIIVAGAVHLVEKFIVKPPPGEGSPPVPFIQIKWRR